MDRVLFLVCVILYYVKGGDAGNSLSEDTIPQKPGSFDVKPAGNTAFSATWTPPIETVVVRGYKLGYGVSDPGDNEIETDRSTYTLTIANLLPDTKYILRLFAFNNFGDGLPVYYWLSTAPAGGDGTSGQLTPPIILDTEVTDSGIMVSWTGIDGANDGRYYVLRYRPKPPSRWTSINSTETSYLVEDLEPDTLYTFDVKVIRGLDESIPSLETFGRTSAGDGSGGATNVTRGDLGDIPEGCEPISVPLCAPVPYNYTTLPNLLGHTSQSEINPEVLKWLPIIVSGCSELVGFFVCSLYVPPCSAQIQHAISPCRDVCTTIKRECQAAVDATEGFDWPEELQCEYFPSVNNTDGEICFSPDLLPPGLEPPGAGGNGTGQPGFGDPFGPDGPPAEYCEPIGDITMCNDIPYNYTMFPNMLGHEEQGHVQYDLLMWSALIESECSPLLRFFVCSVHLPVCTILQVIVPPCREFCEISRDPCQQEMEKQGFEWPEALTCEKFPPESGGFCLGLSGIGPGGPGPDGQGPDGQGPDGQGPDGQGPDGQGPDGQGPDGQGPDGQGPDGAGPDGPDREGNFTDGGLREGPDIQEGTATCEPLSEDAKAICPGLEYTETIFPNSLGHRDQNEAIEMLNAQAALMDMECSVGVFLCVLALPPCKRFGENDENAVPLLPCREECAYVETACVDLDFDTVFDGVNKWSGNLDCSNFPEVYSFPPVCWEINNDFLTDAKPGEVDKGSDGQCNGDVSDVCRDLGFKTTTYPNVFNHADESDVAKVFEELQPLIDSECSDDILPFLCAAHFPVCDANGTTIMPCHETCRQIWKPCKDTATQLGIDRPKAFGCSKNYPSSKEGAVCVDSFVPPTEQPRVKSLARVDPNQAVFEISAIDDAAKYIEVEIYGPSDVKKIKFDTSGDPTEVTVPDLDPGSQYFVNINTANEFGKSESISEIIEKVEGVKCMNLEIEMCQDLGYESGLADGSPNALGHLEQAEALTELIKFKPLIDFGCSPDMLEFLCWLFAPGCSPDMTEVEPPCRESCDSSRFGCEPLMQGFGFEWPDILDCEQFPYKNDTESTCQGGERISTYETPDSDGSEYICKKLFETGPQPVWLDQEDSPIGEDDSPIYSTVINSRITRLTIPDSSPGDYTCVAGDLISKAVVDVQGTCHPSSDHPICKQHFDSFFLPNSLNQTSRNDAMLSVNAFMPILASNCSQYLSQFACYLYLPNKGCQSGANATNGPEAGFGTTNTPCRELCLKVQYDCESEINELGYLWPEQASCDNLPSASEGQCDSFGISELDLLIFSNENATGFTDFPDNYTELVTDLPGNYTDATGFTDLPDNYTELYTDFPENYTEFVTLEPEFVTESFNDTGDNDTTGGELGPCEGIKPRRYDIEDLGSDCLFRGWVDVQGQGAANDYCRIVSNGGPQFLSCALAGSSDDHVYTSPNASEEWFDAGHTDTWYMKDEDGDGRDDYCRCVGIPPETVVSCLKAEETGFLGTDDFEIEGSNSCQYNKVNPFFGVSYPPPP